MTITLIYLFSKMLKVTKEFFNDIKSHSHAKSGILCLPTHSPPNNGETPYLTHTYKMK
jgi:hypothetical protein